MSSVHPTALLPSCVSSQTLLFTQPPTPPLPPPLVFFASPAKLRWNVPNPHVSTMSNFFVCGSYTVYCLPPRTPGNALADGLSAPSLQYAGASVFVRVAVVFQTRPF